MKLTKLSTYIGNYRRCYAVRKPDLELSDDLPVKILRTVIQTYPVAGTMNR